MLAFAGYACWSAEQGYRRERGGTRMDKGIPDLIIAGKGRTAFVELKVGRRSPTPHQAHFLATWRANGGEAMVWRSVADAQAWINAGMVESKTPG